MTWNISNVGAIAGEAGARATGSPSRRSASSTTALFVTHLAVQIPGGRLIDRVGVAQRRARRARHRRRGQRDRSHAPSLGVGLAARAADGPWDGRRLRRRDRPRSLRRRRAVLAGRLRRRHDGSRRAGADDRPTARRRARLARPLLDRARARSGRRPPRARGPSIARLGESGAADAAPSAACSATGGSGRSAACRWRRSGSRS